jgi:hypothetical protein
MRKVITSGDRASSPSVVGGLMRRAAAAATARRYALQELGQGASLATTIPTGAGRTAAAASARRIARATRLRQRKVHFVGQCITGINLDSGSGDGTSGEGCINVDVTFEKQIPTVVLLIDQSGSMEEQFGGAGTRWNVVKNALMDQTTGIVKVLENDVRFGLALYTSHDGNNGGTCPILTDVMPPALANFNAINAVYGPANSDGETPTGESIDAVAAALDPFAEPGPKAIVPRRTANPIPAPNRIRRTARANRSRPPRTCSRTTSPRTSSA